MTAYRAQTNGSTRDPASANTPQKKRGGLSPRLNFFRIVDLSQRDLIDAPETIEKRPRGGPFSVDTEIRLLHRGIFA